jgi:hypothetical protein
MAVKTGFQTGRYPDVTIDCAGSSSISEIRAVAADSVTVCVVCGPLRYLRYETSFLVGSKQGFAANDAKDRK